MYRPIWRTRYQLVQPDQLQAQLSLKYLNELQKQEFIMQVIVILIEFNFMAGKNAAQFMIQLQIAFHLSLEKVCRSMTRIMDSGRYNEIISS